MNDLLWFVGGFVLSEAINFSFRFYKNSIESRERSEALQVLRSHGMSPQLYLSTIGEENLELRNAMEAFAYTGHIIMNEQGEIVGKICQTAKKTTNLRLVVNNK
jgi:hypothetical protein